MSEPSRRRPVPDRPGRFTPIARWPLEDRPREKLWRDGPRSLTESELLAILIRTGTRGRTALDLARQALSGAQSLRDLSRKSVTELVRLGLGRTRATAIVAAFELSRRLPLGDGSRRAVIRSPEDVAARFVHKLRDLTQEEFWALLLTSAGTVLKEVRVSVGTLNASLVHPRECFHAAMTEKAASVIFIHNHPSGDPEPSQEDIAVTRQLAESGKILGIPVQDHLVIGCSGFVSFAERGLLS